MNLECAVTIAGIRTKILFSEGALKKDLKRPKFERMAERFDRNIREFAMGFMSAPSYAAQAQEIYCGADISTLTRMIEAGEI